MSTYKVEICGVNTAQLPILKEEEKEEGRGGSREEGEPSDHRQGCRGCAGVQRGHQGQGIHRPGRSLRLW